MKRNFIVSTILIILMITALCLKSVWLGFMYFSLSFLILLCLYWIINLILYYLQDYYYSFEEDFMQYRAEVINDSLVTTASFDENKELYIKKFKKSLRKYKLIDIAKMIFLLMVVVVCIVAMARGSFKV